MPKVTIRKVNLGNGKVSLYSDTYPAPSGAPRKKSLGIYLTAKPQTPLERKFNSEQLAIAEGIAMRKANELSKPEIYSEAELDTLQRKEKGYYSFFQFAERQVNKIEGSGIRVYRTAILYFKLFLGLDIKCSDINLLMVDEFKDYLPTAKKLRSDATISHNSASTYFAAFCSILRDCYKAEYLTKDFGSMVEGIAPKDARKEGLSLAEIQILAVTDCALPRLKEMALFSCLTGLRFSDCQRLSWSNVKGNSEDGFYLDFTQQKTDGDMLHHISNEAHCLLLAAGGVSAKNPFGDVDYHNMQFQFRKWVEAANLGKHITFHTFRHSYACMLLENDVDLFTVSKMLGHRSIRSTQVYAKVVDNKKKLAANSISLNL